ncbi:helix-turn-helix domain-containing protein [Piscinibacter koreensis]|uniref:Helix-turn-helix domain-containing protein n=1 Tax=Piscinibacter koreensis TaxID=2742824 RepID=A0A7Y6NN71_9BURK|nr:helix-turn-helix domain-containing protein [Schlegelella koreensis]NUZ06191.1 helix-turn-helix domain-containing protein [Schlegelella koreensis]
MNEATASTAAGGAQSAGALLRAARMAQGIEIEALAAAIKVTPHKLELLEQDRHAELPDATFARALAQTVCRALRIDPSPVLRLLPPAGGYRIEQVDEGLNTPFRERPGHFVPQPWAVLASAKLWVGLVFVLAALIAVLLLPSKLFSVSTTPRPVAASPAASSTPTTVTEVIPAAGTDAVASGTVAPEAAASDAPADAASGAGGTPIVHVQASAPSWVEITDAQGQVLLGRSLKAGEALGVDGSPPLRVRIGNAAATQLSFRGEPLALAAYTRDNVARLELK